MPKSSFKVNFKLLIPAVFIIILLLVLAFFSKNYLLSETSQKSTANFKINGSILKVDFNIADNDKADALKLSKSLDVSKNWMDGIEIELDKDSLEWISSRMPEQIFLNFKDDSLSFSSSSVYILENSLPSEKINFATGSSKLKFNKKRNGDFSLNLKSPEELVFYATTSGKLKTSDKMKAIFPILNKIDTIDITLQEKNMKGNLSL